MYTVRVIMPGEALEDAYAVRTAVFVEEQGFPLHIEIDTIDPTATHLVYYDREKCPVATGRVFADGEAYHIGRIAVVRELRGEGLGRRVMEELEKLAYRQGGRRTILGAQCRAIPFYTHLGYRPIGEVFDEEGCPHQMMEKLLTDPEDASM